MDNKIDDIKYHNRIWYLHTYENLMKKGLSRGLNKKLLDYYTEVHHILPKCMGGTDKKCNLVLLTPREHLIAHLLLSKMYPDDNKLLFAVSAMLMRDKNRLKDKSYSISTKDISYYRERTHNLIKGIPLTEEHRHKISVANKGKKRSDKIRKEMSTRLTGRRLSKDWSDNISKSLKGLKRNVKKKVTNEHSKRKIIDSNGVIYESLTKCAEAYNVSLTTIRSWIKNKPEKGFKYLDESPTKLKISGNNIIFNNIQECSRYFNRSESTINRWINDPENKDFFFINSTRERVRGFKKVIDLNTNTIYNSINECSKAFNVKACTISRWIKNNPEKNLKLID